MQKVRPLLQLLAPVLAAINALAAPAPAPAPKQLLPFEQDFPFQISVVGSRIVTNTAPRVDRYGRPALSPDGKPIADRAAKPGDNAMKGIAIKLANGANICFDTDLLRVSAGWTGNYMQFYGVTFNGMHGGWPVIAGEQRFGTPMLPGWADASGSFKDPRKEPFGPIPEAQGRWNGLYLVGEKVVLHYTVGGTKVWEHPTTTAADGLTGFVRNFKTETATRDLAMMVCEMEDADGKVEGRVASLLKGDCCILSAGLVGAPAGVTFAIADRNRIVMKIAKGTPASLFQLVLWRGEQAEQDKFASLLKGKPEMPAFEKGGPARWPQTVETHGILEMSSSRDGAYVTDVLPVPEKNPWDRRFRPSAFDFFSDGKRAAVCTWDGDVWIVSGIDDKLEKLTWRRFASGGFETLGLKIVDDVIYTSGRDQITRYHDLNGDGECDYYENFNNQITSSTGFHEFVFDLQTDRDGNFYFAKAGPVRGGGRGFGTLPGDDGGSFNFGTITEHAGAILKVSKDGKNLDVYARGFRAPNGIGVSPDGQVTSSDNEGTWVPVCPLDWVKPGGQSIVQPDSDIRANPNKRTPLMWFSKGWDNSGGGQAWVTGDKWGPLSGELLHTSYGQCALYLIMKQKAGDLMQGGAVRIPVKFTSSAMRPRFNPKDGQLYVMGLRGWQTVAAREGGFDRVRYTGKPLYTVRDLRVDKAGLHLTFTQPLAEADAKDVQNYGVEMWNYLETFANDMRSPDGHVVRAPRPENNYGAHEVSALDPGKLGHDKLDVKSAKLSADGKTVTLEIPGLKPVQQLLLKFLLKAKDGTPIEQEVMATIHVIP
ncbi:MAG: hypothetical protein HY301_14520 [Verrucomicrobia bacterium]|nr:hypothetical protein [Verrucomicrobiota bacterium]